MTAAVAVTGPVVYGAVARLIVSPHEPIFWLNFFPRYRLWYCSFPGVLIGSWTGLLLASRARLLRSSRAKLSIPLIIFAVYLFCQFTWTVGCVYATRGLVFFGDSQPAMWRDLQRLQTDGAIMAIFVSLPVTYWYARKSDAQADGEWKATWICLALNYLFWGVVFAGAWYA